MKPENLDDIEKELDEIMPEKDRTVCDVCHRSYNKGQKKRHDLTHSHAEKVRVNNTCVECNRFIPNRKIRWHILRYHGTKCLDRHILKIKKLRVQKPSRITKDPITKA